MKKLINIIAILLWLFLGLFIAGIVIDKTIGIDNLFNHLNKNVYIEDFEMSFNQNNNNVIVYVLPGVEIKELNIELELYDSNGIIFEKKKYTFNDLEIDKTYSYSFTLSLSERLKTSNYNVRFIDGKKA